MPQLTAVNSNTNGSGQIMQSASSSAGREATKRRLPRYLVVIFTVLLPLGCITFLAACVGTFILTDPENKYWISRTRFAELYKRIILANVATNMVAFNGSAYGCLFMYAKLREHAQAVQLEKSQEQVQAPTLSRQERRQQMRDWKKEGEGAFQRKKNR